MSKDLKFAMMENLLGRVESRGQTRPEQAASFQALTQRLQKLRPSFLIEPGAEVFRIDTATGDVVATEVGAKGLHLRYEHVANLVAALGGFLAFRPQTGVMLVVPLRHVRLAPGDPF